MPITSGIPAPEFELFDDTNTLRKLTDFRGRNVVLYFYPKDDTPGCTKEACNFRDDYSAYDKTNCKIWSSLAKMIMDTLEKTKSQYDTFNLQNKIPKSLVGIKEYIELNQSDILSMSKKNNCRISSKRLRVLS